MPPPEKVCCSYKIVFLSDRLIFLALTNSVASNARFEKNEKDKKPRPTGVGHFLFDFSLFLLTMSFAQPKCQRTSKDGADSDGDAIAAKA